LIPITALCIQATQNAIGLLISSGDLLNSVSKNAAVTLVAGLGLIIPAAMGLLVSDVATVVSPFPALTVLPAFRLSDLHLWNLAVILPMLLFFV
jgi:hypothetical protein